MPDPFDELNPQTPDRSNDVFSLTPADDWVVAAPRPQPAETAHPARPPQPPQPQPPQQQPPQSRPVYSPPNPAGNPGTGIPRYQTPTPAAIDPAKPPAAPKPKKKSVGFRVAAAVLAVLIVGLAGGISAYFYIDSDGYRVREALEAFDAGDYDEAGSLLRDVDTRQANTMKAFIDLDHARENCIKTMETASVDDGLLAVAAFADRLAAFREAYDLSELPDKEQTIFAYCEAAVSHYETGALSRETAPTLRAAFIELQQIMLNDIEANAITLTGNTYTPAMMQGRLDRSVQAAADLRALDYFTEVEGRMTFGRIPVDDPALTRNAAVYFGDNRLEDGVSLSHGLRQTVLTMDNYCEKEIEDYTEKMKTYAPDARLRISNPQQDFTKYVGSGLREIASQPDLEANADQILRVFQRDVDYFLLAGKAFPSDEN